MNRINVLFFIILILNGQYVFSDSIIENIEQLKKELQQTIQKIDLAEQNDGSFIAESKKLLDLDKKYSFFVDSV